MNGAALPGGFLSRLRWQYVATIAGGVLQFAYAAVVGAELGASAFGLLSLALAVVTILFQLVELRLHEAVIKFVVEFRENGDDARMLAALKLFLAADVATGALAFLLAAVAAPFVGAQMLGTADGARIVLLAAASVLMLNVATATSLGVFRVFGEFGLHAAITTAGAVLKLAITFAGIRLFGAGVAGVLVIATVVHFVTNLALALTAVSLIARRVGTKMHAPLSLLDERKTEIRRFVGHTYLLSLTMIPTKELDTTLLGWFAPLPVVGTYRYAKTFAVALMTLVDPIFYVIYPELARMWVRRQFAALRAFVMTITRVMGALVVVAVAAAFVIVPPIVASYAGGEYAAAGNLFRWMIAGLLFWAPLLWINPLLMAAGRSDLTLRASLYGSAIVFLAYGIAIPALGATGAAIGYALASPAVVTFAVLLGRRAGIVFPAEAA